MRVKYSKHVEQPLSLRRIDYDLPKRIFDESNERYFDEETGHFIATMEVSLYNEIRDVMIAYVFEEDFLTLLTIHSLKKGQKENRVEPHGLKSVAPPQASSGGTLRSTPYCAPLELRRVPSSHSSTV